MGVRNRITALRFLEKQKRDPEYAKRLGIKVEVKQPLENTKRQESNH